jgi:hypothetical protein
MARAAINIIGTGEKFDFVSMGGTEVTCYRQGVGVYCVTGTLGMVPFPPSIRAGVTGSTPWTAQPM